MNETHPTSDQISQQERFDLHAKIVALTLERDALALELAQRTARVGELLSELSKYRPILRARQ